MFLNFILETPTGHEFTSSRAGLRWFNGLFLLIISEFCRIVYARGVIYDGKVSIARFSFLSIIIFAWSVISDG